ncbi:MAG: GntR family transcriptional regulator [Kiritimatiellales bacterium]|nr:GntR family transcriptional regulator [Kiritimatiellota bacterium]MBL7012511.1 GntR family transcriptional regulator [Kiritimatiellales bacterium]
MASIGKLNWLPVLRSTDFGLLLDGGDLGEILMPNRYVTDEWKPGDVVEVFLMLDSEDRLTATTEKPLAMVDEFALLRVVAVTGIGAFLDWGLPKDLLVPFREQNIPLREGQSVVVRIYLDELTNRIAASAKLDKFLDRAQPDYAPDEKVKLLICSKTDLGFKAIINNKNWGVIFHNEVFQPLEKGQRIEGYIKQIRPDGKIDLSLQKPGAKSAGTLADVILDYIKEQGGFMPITDKSPPEEIYALFGVSKKAYKRAIGGLYKKRLITFENNGTKLVGG